MIHVLSASKHPITEPSLTIVPIHRGVPELIIFMNLVSPMAVSEIPSRQERKPGPVAVLGGRVLGSRWRIDTNQQQYDLLDVINCSCLQ